MSDSTDIVTSFNRLFRTIYYNETLQLRVISTTEDTGSIILNFVALFSESSKVLARMKITPVIDGASIKFSYTSAIFEGDAQPYIPGNSTPADSEITPGSQTPLYYTAVVDLDEFYTKAGIDRVVPGSGTSLPIVSIVSSVNQIAENSSTVPTFTFRRNQLADVSSPLTVYYTVSGTATSSSDYTGNFTGSVTIPQNEYTVTKNLNVINDSSIESTETVIVTLNADDTYTLGSPSIATISITDDDTPAALPTVTITAQDASASETSPNPGAFRISRDIISSSPLQVYFATTGTATPTLDYTALPASATILANQSYIDVPVTVVDDNVIESAETVIATLTTNSNYTVGSPNTATVTITDNDFPAVVVNIVATDSSAAEVASGTANGGLFTVSRTGSTTSSLVVNYSIGGTATGGSDYTTLSGTVTIASGATTATIPITVIDDATLENSETVILTLNSGSGYTIGSNSFATVNIADNDAPVIISSTINFEALAVAPYGSATYDDPAGYTFLDTLPFPQDWEVYGVVQGFQSKVLHPGAYGQKVTLKRTNDLAFDLVSIGITGGRYGEATDGLFTGVFADGSTQTATFAAANRNVVTYNLGWNGLAYMYIDFTPGSDNAWGAIDNVSVRTSNATITPPSNNLPAARLTLRAGTSNLGVNLDSVSYYVPITPFKNLCYQGSTWFSNGDGLGFDKGPTIPLDSNGWPTSLQTNCYADMIMTSENSEAGTYVLLWDGEGTFANGDIECGTLVSETTGRAVLTIGANQSVQLRIKHTNPANHLRNFRLVKQADESSYVSAPFKDSFLNLVKPFSLIRTMDWTKTNHSPIVNWSERSTPSYAVQQCEDPTRDDGTGNYVTQRIAKGVCWEYVIDLANTLNDYKGSVNKHGPDIWVCIPAKATDDYVTQMATLFLNTLNDDSKIYVEYSNEVWNGIFDQATYAREQGYSLALASSEDGDFQSQIRYYAYRAKQVMDIWADVWSEFPDRILRVASGWSALPYYNEQVLGYNNAALYNSTDVLAIAPYFEGHAITINGHDTNLVAYDLDDSDRAVLEDQLANTTSVSTMIGYCATDVVEGGFRDAQITANVQMLLNNNWESMALVGYEGGPHLFTSMYSETNQATITEKFRQVNISEDFKPVCKTYLDTWYNAGGNSFCWFSLSGTATKYGFWGLYLPDKTPKYDACTEWIADNEEAPFS